MESNISNIILISFSLSSYYFVVFLNKNATECTVLIFYDNPFELCYQKVQVRIAQKSLMKILDITKFDIRNPICNDNSQKVIPKITHFPICKSFLQ